MARPKKTDDKVKEASTLSINVDDFVRTRDSVRLSPFLLFPPPPSDLEPFLRDSIYILEPRRL